MKLICGLGNPGSKYENTRHNVGFYFIDRFSDLNGFPEFKEKWNALYSERGTGDEKIVLLKPLTFMNLSGEAVAKFANFYKIDRADVVVVYDDVDLPLGSIRFRDQGGAGTHNGMKSVIQHLGGEDFPRLRIGIESRGVSSPAEMPIDAFVLAPFSEEERAVFKNSIDEAMDVLEKTLAK